MSAAPEVVRVEVQGPAVAGDLGGGIDAVALAEQGLLYRAGESLLALRRLDPPEVSVPTVRVLAYDERVLTAEQWPVLAATLLETFTADRLQLRSSAPPETLERLGLRVFLHFVAKRAVEGASEGVELRPAQWPADHDYVADLMCASLRSGMPQARFSDEQLDVYVQGYLRLGKPGGCDALISWVDGVRVGTVVFRPEHDELRGTPMTRLVDIMTDYQGRGHGWRIAPAFESYVATTPDLPDTIVGTVVGEDDKSDRHVVGRLQDSGWILDHSLWVQRA